MKLTHAKPKQAAPKAICLYAMSLNISTSDGHPNKMPFAGVLTYLDRPSDYPPGGSGGRNIVVTSAAAEKALPTLLGMAVDFTPSFDGHDSQAKIGLITSANIVDSSILIEGFVYAADFPGVAERIQAEKAELGFSFEAQRIRVEDPSADPLVIVELSFTGAAILRKDVAAYQTTSLAASADKDIQMTKEELQEILAEAIKPLNERLEKIETDQAEQIEANKATMAMVEPHARTLESCAGGMEAAGIGVHPSDGHAVHLRRMAGAMRADAATGRIPSSYTPGYSTASIEKDELDMNAAEVEKIVKDAVDAATKPLVEKLAAAESKAAETETKLADNIAAQRTAVRPPERKTIPPAIMAALSRANFTVPEGDGKVDLSGLDVALKSAGIEPQKRIEVKVGLERAGLL